MLRKMVIMRMLMGNMRRPLSTPMMTSAQVTASDPEASQELKAPQRHVEWQYILTNTHHYSAVWVCLQNTIKCSLFLWFSEQVLL